MIPGAWSPGGFPSWVTLIAKIAIYGTMLVRGVDLLAGDSDDTARRLSVVEAAAPIQVWGVIMTTGAVIGLVSILLRLGRGVLTGHLIGMASYGLLAVGVLVDVLHRTPMTWAATADSALILGAGGVACACAARWARWQHAVSTTAGITIALAVAALATHLDGLRSVTILLTIGIIHGLMAIGTAAHLRQAKIMQEVSM